MWTMNGARSASRSRLARCLAVAGIVLVAAAIGGWWMVGSKKAPKTPSPLGNDAAGNSPLADRRGEPSPLPAPHGKGDPPPAAWSAWPANDQPITERWALLAPRAMEGDAVAACRLGIELIECERRLSEDGHVGRESRRGALADLDALVGLADHVSDWQSEAAITARNRDRPTEYHETRAINARHAAKRRRIETAICDGLDPSKAASGPRWLREASLVGQPDAQVAYLMLYRRWLNHPGALQDPEFAMWRSVAPTILDRLLKSGDTRAPHLVDTLLRESGGAGALLPSDPLRAAAAARVRDWLANASTRSDLQRPAIGEHALDDAALTRVTQLALEMAAHFPDRTRSAQDAYGPPDIGRPGHDCGLASQEGVP